MGKGNENDTEKLRIETKTVAERIYFNVSVSAIFIWMT